MNKIIKILINYCLIVILLNCFAFWLIAKPALAADFTITCWDDTLKCVMTPLAGQPLFYEKNWLPGNSVTRTVTAVNKYGEACDLIMDIRKTKETFAGFSTKLFTCLKDRTAAGPFYGSLSGSQAGVDKTMADLFSDASLSFGNLAVGQTRYFDWTVTFDPLTNNDYQGKELVFDFDLTFTCGKPDSSPAPTATPTPASPTPGSPSPESKNQLTAGTQSFTEGLSFFPFSVGGFFRNILGVEDEAEPSPTALPKATAGPEPEVKGEAVCPWWSYLWWLPLLFQLGLTIVYYYWLMKKDNEDEERTKPRYWWMAPLGLALCSQIIHQYLGCECVDSGLCPWYWLFNLLILFLPMLYYYFSNKN